MHLIPPCHFRECGPSPGRGKAIFQTWFYIRPRSATPGEGGRDSSIVGLIVWRSGIRNASTQLRSSDAITGLTGRAKAWRHGQVIGKNRTIGLKTKPCHELLSGSCSLACTGAHIDRLQIAQYFSHGTCFGTSIADSWWYHEQRGSPISVCSCPTTKES